MKDEQPSTPSAGAKVDPQQVELARELLKAHRESIDNIDAALVHVLAERFKFTQAVGALKAKYDLPPGDPEREREQVERLTALAHDAGLDPVFTTRFLHFIVTEVIRHHETMADDQ